jgi:hypothetical protein
MDFCSIGRISNTRNRIIIAKSDALGGSSPIQAEFGDDTPAHIDPTSGRFSFGFYAAIPKNGNTLKDDHTENDGEWDTRPTPTRESCLLHSLLLFATAAIRLYGFLWMAYAWKHETSGS